MMGWMDIHFRAVVAPVERMIIVRVPELDGGRHNLTNGHEISTIKQERKDAWRQRLLLSAA